MAKSSSSRQTDLVMCDSFFNTTYFEVAHHLFQLEIRPFLTQSQVDNGSTVDWFYTQHFNEVLALLRPVIIKSFSKGQSSKSDGKKSQPKDSIITGDRVRIACSFKSCNLANSYLLNQFGCRSFINYENSGKMRSKYRSLTPHKEKLVVYVCPRSSSSILQLSQLVNSEPKTQEDISKYFSTHKWNDEVHTSKTGRWQKKKCSNEYE